MTFQVELLMRIPSSLPFLTTITTVATPTPGAAMRTIMMTLQTSMAKIVYFYYSAHWIYKPASVIRVAVAIGSVAALPRGWI